MPCAKRGAVDDELRIEQDGAHHEGRQKVLLEPLLRKGCTDGNRPVHAQWRGDAKEAGGNPSNRPCQTLPQTGAEAVDALLGEHRHKRPQRHAKHPVPENLAELEVGIVPEINRLALKNVKHTGLLVQTDQAVATVIDAKSVCIIQNMTALLAFDARLQAR